MKRCRLATEQFDKNLPNRPLAAFAMDQFDQASFNARLEEALAVAEKVLGQDKLGCVSSPSDVEHGYVDKFCLATAQVNAAVVSLLDALKVAGLDACALAAARDHAAASSATLRFAATTSCAFSREAVREEEGKIRVKATSLRESVESVISGVSTTSVSTLHTDYFWMFSWSWSLELYRGSGRGEGDVLRLAGRTATLELKTAAKTNPCASQNAQNSALCPALSRLVFLSLSRPLALPRRPSAGGAVALVAAAAAARRRRCRQLRHRPGGRRVQNAAPQQGR